MSSPEQAVVCDIGGTNTRVGVTQAGQLFDYDIFPTPQDADELFYRLGQHIYNFARLGDVNVRECVLAMPGPISRQQAGVVEGINIPGLEDPFLPAERLADEHQGLKDMNIVLLNDAEAATLAAARIYAINENADPLLYLGIGTGLGSDISVDYETLSHKAECNIELAYMHIRQSDGSFVMLGDRVNGTSIKKLYGEGVKTAEDIYKDPSTSDAWEAVGADLANAIAVVSPLFSIKQIVIGGGVGANCRGRIEEPLQTTLNGIFDVAPEIGFVAPSIEKIIALQGCCLALEQR